MYVVLLTREVDHDEETGDRLRAHGPEGWDEAALLPHAVYRVLDKMHGHAGQEDPERVAGQVHDHNADEDDGQVVLRARVGLLHLVMMFVVVVVEDVAAAIVVIVVAAVVALDVEGGRAAAVPKGEGAADAWKQREKVTYLSKMQLRFLCSTRGLRPVRVVVVLVLVL